MRYLVLVGMLAAALASGCARPADPASLRQNLPTPPATADFGPLYPRVNKALTADSPDVYAALRATVSWANAHLEHFTDGSCGSVQIVYDSEFARIFGRTTLGVTLPWMQLYIRDGNRESDPFLWKDPTLFVSTILHEFVHSAQRAHQAESWLGASDCESARAALEARRPTWNAGFDQLRSSPTLSGNFAAEDRALLYRWTSPIERARDEVDAALTTVRWMHGHSDELNELTAGGANNWAYGVQFLGELKSLGTTDCFSPDDGTYGEELKIYQTEIPAMIDEYAQYEDEMKSFLSQHSIPISRLHLAEARDAVAKPTGRKGSRCSASMASPLPAYSLPEGIHIHPE